MEVYINVGRFLLIYKKKKKKRAFALRFRILLFVIAVLKMVLQRAKQRGQVRSG
jgi:hypothetical protein